jgi:hypothetical protein
MVERLTLCNSVFSEYLICARWLLCKPAKTATLAVRIILLGACPGYLINRESRKTKLNIWDFGGYIHLGTNKQQASNP